MNVYGSEAWYYILLVWGCDNSKIPSKVLISGLSTLENVRIALVLKPSIL